MSTFAQAGRVNVWLRRRKAWVLAAAATVGFLTRPWAIRLVGESVIAHTRKQRPTVAATDAAFTGMLLKVASGKHHVSQFAQRSSAFLGVSWHEGSRQWQAEVDDPKTQELVRLGLFTAERDAAHVADCAKLVLHGTDATTNFPADSYSKEDIEDQKRLLEDVWHVRHSSTYRGVYRIAGSNGWKAEFEMHHVKQFLGDFDTEIEAAEAVDCAIRSTGVERALRLPQLNFRHAGDYFSEETWQEEPIPRGWTSRFLGVSWHQPSGQFRARLRRKHLGLFDDELEAAKAFDEASQAEGGFSNFEPTMDS